MCWTRIFHSLVKVSNHLYLIFVLYDLCYTYIEHETHRLNSNLLRTKTNGCRCLNPTTRTDNRVKLVYFKAKLSLLFLKCQYHFRQGTSTPAKPHNITKIVMYPYNRRTAKQMPCLLCHNNVSSLLLLLLVVFIVFSSTKAIYTPGRHSFLGLRICRLAARPTYRRVGVRMTIIDNIGSFTYYYRIFFPFRAHTWWDLQA